PQPHAPPRLNSDGANADPAHLDPPRQRGGRADHKASVMHFEVKAVIADEAGEPKQGRFRPQKERQRPLWLFPSSPPPGEHAPPARPPRRGGHQQGLRRPPTARPPT